MCWTGRKGIRKRGKKVKKREKIKGDKRKRKKV